MLGNVNLYIAPGVVSYVCGIRHCGILYVEKTTHDLLTWISLQVLNFPCSSLPVNVIWIYGPCIWLICWFLIHLRQFIESEIDLHLEKRSHSLWIYGKRDLSARQIWQKIKPQHHFLILTVAIRIQEEFCDIIKLLCARGSLLWIF